MKDLNVGLDSIIKFLDKKGEKVESNPNVKLTDHQYELLVEGFDRRSCFFTYYNYPYYIDHLTALGYGKDVDWVENYITVPYDEKTLTRWQKLSDFALKHYHLHSVTAKNRLAYIPLLKGFFSLYIDT